MAIVRNLAAANRGAHPLRAVITIDGARAAHDEISSWASYAPTPLRSLAPLAAQLGIRKLYYKDESARFGLDSFKALGGAYAVARLLQRRVSQDLGRPIEIAELANGTHRERTQLVTAVSATDGNHGRSVAAGAAMFGCRCVIVLHAGVSRGREQAIASRGAEIIRVAGDFDDAVEEAARLSRHPNWELVADTSSDGGEQACLDVMHGYTVMACEALDQVQADNAGLLTHTFVQAGVGGLAGSVCAHNWNVLGSRAPLFVVVEPERADCLFQSARAGKAQPATGDLQTVMAGLACGEVSELAWAVLSEGAEFFMTISDTDAIETMRLLSERDRVGASIVAGESAGAGLAGLIKAAQDEDLRRQLRLDSDSSVLVFGTEGATDPEIYRALVGRALPA